MPDEKAYPEYESIRNWTRPSAKGQNYAIASGHHLASQAAMRILDRGGNVVDAGIAAGLCLCILQPDMVNFAGVAPLMVHLTQTDETHIITGIGPWPQAASVEYFEEKHDKSLPEGILRTVVPGSPDSWLRALKLYGTMTFKAVVGDALYYAGKGFPAHRFLHNGISEHKDGYQRWPQNAQIFLPSGNVPETGEIFYQKDLASVIKEMIREEEKAGRVREEGIDAARDYFYKGPLAEKITAFHQENCGFLAMDDLAEYEGIVEEPVCASFGEYTIKTGRAWCQGPVLLSVLNILEEFDLKNMTHNSVEYVHTIVEAFKLVYSDREAWYGDPDYTVMPERGLISEEYAKKRASCIDPELAFAGMPPYGDPWEFDPGKRPEQKPEIVSDLPKKEGRDVDTSFVSVMDKDGNCFCAAPSDTSFSGPVVPGTGMVISTRGSQSWGISGHPSEVAGGKRPRLTPHTSMIFKDGKPVMIIGTPGGDVQCQAIVQVFLNMVLFKMSVQEAIEAPRFATFSFPGSFSPHAYNPGLMKIEERLFKEVAEGLEQKGHKATPWVDMAWKSGGVCVILKDEEKGILCAGADPRRESVAIAW